MPTVTIPDKPQRDLSPLELSASNLYGPGVSYVNGRPNPAGVRSGVVTTCTTTAQVNTAFSTAGYGDDIVLTASTVYTGTAGDGGQFHPTSVPAITATTPRVPPRPMQTWTALTGLITQSPVPLTAPPPAMTTRNVPLAAVTPQGDPAYIRVMSTAWASLPDGMTVGSVGRIAPDDAALLPVLKGKTGTIVGIQDCMTFDTPYVNHWRFEGIRLECSDLVTDVALIVDMGRWTFGGNPPPMNQLDNHIIFDRCWFNADPTNSGSGNTAGRGIYFGCPSLGLISSYFNGFNTGLSVECSAVLFDSVDGPVHYENTYFSASTQCVMTGGSGPVVYGLNTKGHDVTIKHCEFAWPTKWQIDIATGAAGTVAVSGTTVTGTGTNFTSVDNPVSYFFAPTGTTPGNPLVACTVNSDSSITTSVPYPTVVAGNAWGLVNDAMYDSPALSGSTVTVTVSGGNTVTRSAGTWPSDVRTGLYFSRLTTASAFLTRYLITALTPTTLTVSGSPSNVSNVADWMVGAYDGIFRNGQQKNLLEFKGCLRYWVYGCVFHDYWFDPQHSAQQYPAKFVPELGIATAHHFTLEYCKGYNIAAEFLFGNPGPVAGADVDPTLIQNNLWIYANKHFLISTTKLCEIGPGSNPDMAYRHCTYIAATQGTALNIENGQFVSSISSGSRMQWVDNLLAYPGHQAFQANGSGDNDGPSSGSNLALASQGIPQTNVAGNSWFGAGQVQTAAQGLTGNGLLRTGTLAGSRYGNAGLGSFSSMAFTNWTGDQNGNYVLTPVYTTNAAACTVSGATVTISTGTIPTTVAKGTPFRISTDSAINITSVLSRDSPTQATLAVAYPGTTGAGLTGVFSFQGMASDGSTAVLYTTNAGAVTLAPDGAAFRETWNHADTTNSLTADQPWSQLGGAATTGWGIRSQQATVLAQDATTAIVVCNTTLGSPNHEVQTTLATLQNFTSAQGGLIARSDGSAVTLYAVRSIGSTYQLLSFVTGSAAQIGTGGAPAQGDVITLRCSGTTITVLVNGVSVISVTDSSVSTGNFAGLWGQCNTFDQVAFGTVRFGLVGTLNNPTVSINAGSFPTYIAPTNTFLVIGDAASKAAVVASRDSTTQLTLTGFYTGTTGSGLTAAISGIVPSGVDPGANIPAVLAATAGVDT